MASLWQEGKQSKAAGLRRVKEVIEFLVYEWGLMNQPGDFAFADTSTEPEGKANKKTNRKYKRRGYFLCLGILLK